MPKARQGHAWKSKRNECPTPPPSEAILFAESLLAAPEAAAGFVLESALPAAAEFACSHGIGFNA